MLGLLRRRKKKEKIEFPCEGAVVKDLVMQLYYDIESNKTFSWALTKAILKKRGRQYDATDSDGWWVAISECGRYERMFLYHDARSDIEFLDKIDHIGAGWDE